MEDVCGTQNCGEAVADNYGDEMKRKNCGDNNCGEKRLDGVHTQSAQSTNGDPVEDVFGPQNCGVTVVRICEENNCGEYIYKATETSPEKTIKALLNNQSGVRECAMTSNGGGRRQIYGNNDCDSDGEKMTEKTLTSLAVTVKNGEIMTVTVKNVEIQKGTVTVPELATHPETS